MINTILWLQLLVLLTFSLVLILTIFSFILFLHLFHKKEKELSLPKVISDKIHEYWGLNLLRQHHDLWDELGKELPNGKLVNLWVITNQYYETSKKIFIIGFIVTTLGLIVLVLIQR